MPKNFFENNNLVSQIASEEKYPDELKPYVREANDFILNYKGFFDMIGGSLKNPPEYVLDSDVTKPNYWYDHANNKIGLSLKGFVDLKEGGLEKPQILFAVGHELGHFNDMRDDPRSYIDNFNQNERKALKVAPEIMEIWRNRGAKLPDWLTEEKVAKQFLSEQFKDLYNVIDDIYVNRHNLRAMPKFRGDFNGFNDEVRGMYANYFFANPNKSENGEAAASNYSNLPRTKQFLFYMLRKFMVPDEDVIISAEVKKKFEEYFSKSDKLANNNILKSIYEIARPTAASEKKQHTAGVRYEWIGKWIEPIFKEFLLKDALDMPLPKFDDKNKSENNQAGKGDSNQEGEKGENKEGENKEEENKEEENKEGESKDQKGDEDNSKKGENKDEKKSADNSQGEKSKEKSEQTGKNKADQESSEKGEPDVWQAVSESNPISKEVVEKYLKEDRQKKREETETKRQAEEESKLTPEERIKKKQKEADHQTAKENGLNANDVDIYERLEKNIEPYKIQLAETFRQLMENIEERMIMAWERGWRKGKFNINNFIDKYGTFMLSGRNELVPWGKLDVYDRQEFTKKLNLFPNKIRFRLIIDSSGSMDSDNKRIEAMRLAVLMMESLKSFESEVNQRFRLSEEFYVDTQIICFGSEGRSEIVKRFDSENPEADKQVGRWQAAKEIGVDRGSTVDDEAWQMVDDDINYEEELKNNKAMEFCFEITDGGADSDDIARSSRKIVDSLADKGVNVLGFLIGNSDSEDWAKFNIVWNNGSKSPRGFKIENPEDLSLVIAARFSELIRNKQIKIMSEGEVEE